MTTVHISNIFHATTESELNSFFSFCGKITSLSLTPTSGEPNSPKSATLTFERESAAKTAALLDGTPLNSSPLKVELAPLLSDLVGFRHLLFARASRVLCSASNPFSFFALSLV